MRKLSFCGNNYKLPERKLAIPAQNYSFQIDQSEFTFQFTLPMCLILGLIFNNKIVQLSAVTENSSYNRYNVPKTPISSYASKITGLTVVGNSLMLKGAPVPTVSIYNCLGNFILWTQEHVTTK